MTVKDLAEQLNLWTQVEAALQQLLPPDAARALLHRLASLPVVTSRASRSLGAYVSKGGTPQCIRLQFAQEAEILHHTFLHELAHACDHLVNHKGRRYCRAHGPSWKLWAKSLGTSDERCGHSEALSALYRQRIKLVAVCQRCGAEFHRIRRLDRRRKYLHSACGGRLRSV